MSPDKNCRMLRGCFSAEWNKAKERWEIEAFYRDDCRQLSLSETAVCMMDENAAVFTGFFGLVGVVVGIIAESVTGFAWAGVALIVGGSLVSTLTPRTFDGPWTNLEELTS